MEQEFQKEDIEDLIKRHYKLSKKESSGLSYSIDKRKDLLSEIFHIDMYAEIFHHKYYLNIGKKLSYRADMSILEEFRGKGLGRRLVESREAICKELHFKGIVISINSNPSFWTHMGYRSLTKFEYFYLSITCPDAIALRRAKTSYKDLK